MMATSVASVLSLPRVFGFSRRFCGQWVFFVSVFRDCLAKISGSAHASQFSSSQSLSTQPTHAFSPFQLQRFCLLVFLSAHRSSFFDCFLLFSFLCNIFLRHLLLGSWFVHSSSLRTPHNTSLSYSLLHLKLTSTFKRATGVAF